MLFEKTTLEPDNVGGDPGGGPSHPREAAMRDDVIALIASPVLETGLSALSPL
jgi:hypothetical protein